MRIYIAAPYTKGDTGANVHQFFEVADRLANMGHIPYPPLWTHFWHIMTPRSYDWWLSYSDTFIIHWAQALLRLSGESVGADHEVELARTVGIPIYYSIAEVPNEV